MKDLFDKLLERLNSANKVLFMGIGEEKMSDDGVGPYIISQLLSFANEKYLFINAGTDPMARLEEVLDFNPSHLILIDTCTLNAEPGTIAILEREHMQDLVPISSHTIPVHIVLDILIKDLPDLDAFMIGIVPESFEGFTELKLYKEDEISLEERSENIDLPFFDINLTETIQRIANQLISIIKDLMNQL